VGLSVQVNQEGLKSDMPEQSQDVEVSAYSFIRLLMERFGRSGVPKVLKPKNMLILRGRGRVLAPNPHEKVRINVGYA